MSRKVAARNRYAPSGFIGLSSAFVAITWLALWLVWLPLGSVQTGSRVRSTTRSLFSLPQASTLAEMDPRDIIRLERGSEEIGGPAGAVIAQYVREPCYLDRDGAGVVGGGTVGVVPYSSVLNREAPVNERYAPDWHVAPIFPKQAGGAGKLQIQCAGRLKQYGFSLPEPVLRELGKGKLSWELVVHLETDENGRVEHVFLDQGSDDAAVNQKVVKAIYGGHLEAEGVRCEGTVTVSYPGRE